ncbi:hypothetical protein [Streptomyces sp. NPDC008150]|uniref:hypothetical protein n=1 Tax=Streptomyces sp. NPDC008150 TaxID=3364816 RepID=UPI0036E1B8AE
MTAALFIDTLDAVSALCNAFGWWLVLGPAALAITAELAAIAAVLLLRLAWRAARRAVRAAVTALGGRVAAEQGQEVPDLPRAPHNAPSGHTGAPTYHEAA